MSDTHHRHRHSHSHRHRHRHCCRRRRRHPSTQSSKFENDLVSDAPHFTIGQQDKKLFSKLHLYVFYQSSQQRLCRPSRMPSTMFWFPYYYLAGGQFTADGSASQAAVVFLSPSRILWGWVVLENTFP